MGHFRSVELRHGGHVIVRQGPAQRVTMLSGDSRYTDVRLEEGSLVIDNHGGCPPDYRLQIEIVTPEISALSVSNGGTLQTVGSFAAQATIDAAVEQGGRLDIRSVAADAVVASVYSGGGIFTAPRQTLTARVDSGGVITYWGDARVSKTVRHGGVVARGKPADADQPLSEMSPRLPAIPPLPPIR